MGEPGLDFKIRKGQSPAAAAAIRQRRHQFEQEQQDFIHDIKGQISALNTKAGAGMQPSIGKHKLSKKINMKAIELSPLEGR